MRKQITYIRTTLFDSTMARFKLNIEARFTRVNSQTGSQESLCYIDNRGNCILNPNIYLVLTYRGDTIEGNKSLYTSYPQLFEIKSALNEIRKRIEDPNSLVKTEGLLEIKDSAKTPINIIDVGKDKKWISFNMSVIEGADGVREPAVSIQISGNDFTSVLNFSEFYTIYTIINEVNLSLLQTQMATFAVLNNESVDMPQTGGGYQVPQYATQNAPQPPYANQAGGNYYTNGAGSTTGARYNNQGYGQNAYNNNKPQYQQQAPRSAVNNQQAAPVVSADRKSVV